MVRRTSAAARCALILHATACPAAAAAFGTPAFGGGTASPTPLGACGRAEDAGNKKRSSSARLGVATKGGGDDALLGDVASEELRRTAERLDRMRSVPGGVAAAISDGPDENDPYAAELEEMYRELRMRPANDLKEELGRLRLKKTGRKPDLARRLADHYVQERHSQQKMAVAAPEPVAIVPPSEVEARPNGTQRRPPLVTFAGLGNLSEMAGAALANANFVTPSPIQASAIGPISEGHSCVLHAETGSGKTLAYLLPVTEKLWKEREAGKDDGTAGYGLVLTPTRELAAQVAGVATVLAPPGSVRLITTPSNLLKDGSNEKAELPHGGRLDDPNAGRYMPRLIVGSAKSIGISLFGDGKMPGSPTSKPEGKFLLRNVRWLVMDEVDRLLHVKKSRTEKRFKRHEKPAAVLAATVMRLTLGQAQVVAASATVGRPMRRELARVLGLPSQECPTIIRGAGSAREASVLAEEAVSGGSVEGVHVGRAVTIPSGVRNYVVPVDGSTSGSLLTSAAFVTKALPSRRILLVLSKNCGLTVQNTLGALRHFGCIPEPQSLLDVLEADGTDKLIEVHREVSGATGIGESSSSFSSPSNGRAFQDGYLLVTGEDSVRGLHLDELDTVVVVGRPRGPDEYTHIAGRTGRAGKAGNVINIVSYEQAAALTSWEKMLRVDFIPIDENEVSALP